MYIDNGREKHLLGDEASSPLSSLPLLSLCHSSPAALNPAACGGKTNRVHPIAAAPRGPAATFWKVIPTHCSGLKCCHAALVPNCSASSPARPSPPGAPFPAPSGQHYVLRLPS